VICSCQRRAENPDETMPAVRVVHCYRVLGPDRAQHLSDRGQHPGKRRGRTRLTEGAANRSSRSATERRWDPARCLASASARAVSSVDAGSGPGPLVFGSTDVGEAEAALILTQLPEFESAASSAERSSFVLGGIGVAPAVAWVHGVVTVREGQ
jgi:hypothetical protein